MIRIKAAAATLTLLAVLAGLPALLWLVGVNPAPHGLGGIWQDLLLPDLSGLPLLRIATVAGWVCWAIAAGCILTELAAVLSGQRIRLRMPGFGWGQRVAAILIVAMLAGLGTTAVSRATPAAATPAQTVSAPAVTLPAHTPAPAEKKVTAPHGQIVHTVKPGEYLALIADRYLGSEDLYPAIAATNRLDPFTDLAGGQKLIIPVQEGRKPPLHQVKAGEYLWQIAEHELGDGAKYRQIAAANRLDPNDDLAVGQLLVIPVWDAVPGHKPPCDQPLTPKKPADDTRTDGGGDHSKPDSVQKPTVPPSPATTPPPATSRPTTPANTEPAPTNTPAQTPAGEVPLAAVLATTSSVGALLAAGLLTTLSLRRRRQRRDRREGQQLPAPSAEAQDIEAQLRATSHQPHSIAALGQMLCAIAHHTNRTGAPLPELVAVRVAPDRVDLLLAEERLDPPSGVDVDADGSVWTIHAQNTAQLVDDTVIVAGPHPYPALISLGADADGAQILIDLEACGALSVEAADPDDAAAVLTGMATELAVSPWSHDLTVTLVGDQLCPGLEDVLDDVNRADDVDDLLHQLDERATTQRAHLAGDTVGQKRVDPDRADGWAPHIILMIDTLTDDQRARLADLVTELPRVAIAAVTTGTPVTDWVYQLDTTTGHLSIYGWTLNPQRITQEAYRGILELLTASGRTDTHPAPWWDHTLDDQRSATIHHLNTLPATVPDSDELGADLPDPDAANDETAPDKVGRLPAHNDDQPDGLDTLGAGRNSHGRGSDAEDDARSDTAEQDQVSAAGAEADEHVHPVVPIASRRRPLSLDRLLAPEPAPGDAQPSRAYPTLRILGPVQLDHVSGQPTRNPGRCMEILLELLSRPGMSAQTIADRLYISRATVKPVISALRKWLGTNPDDGSLYLPEGAATGGYRTDPRITTDWHQLQHLAGRHINTAPTEALQAALNLVRGRPLEDVQWACAEPIRAAAYQLIVDIAHTLTDRALTDNNIRLARWAASQGLLADPHSEVLLADRLRTEYAAGDRAEAGRIAGQITAQARELGMDLGPDTIDTLQQVVAAGAR